MIADMPKPRYPHLHREKNRHGTPVYYVRFGDGPRTRVRGEYDSDEFRASYAKAIGGESAAPAPVSKHTLRWAIHRYKASPAWSQLAHATRKQKETIFRHIIAASGDRLLTEVNADDIKDGRDRRQHTPHQANVFLKAMRSFFRWAVSDGLIAADPTIDITLLKGENDDIGFHTWTEDELDRFEARWPLGTRERLAYDLLLYTGLRRGDACRVGRQHVRDGVIQIKAEKTGEDLFLPILPPLQASIDATQTSDLALLCNAYGQPWVKESFGNWFRDACRKANVPGAAHGLRKAGATRAAEHGASDRSLMALFGWTSEKMAGRYTRAADRKRLALAAAQLLARTANEKSPHLAPGAGSKENIAVRSTV